MKNFQEPSSCDIGKKKSEAQSKLINQNLNID